MLRVQPNFDNRLEQAGGSIVTLKNFDNRLFFQQGGGDVVWPDITTAAYTGKSFSFSSQDNTVFSIAFTLDGSGFFIVGNTLSVYQYALSAPWDISTASYTGKSFSIAGEGEGPLGMTFKSDGMVFYLISNYYRQVVEYSLSTPWDISTASYTGKSFSIAAQSGTNSGLFFRPDGTGFYISNNSSIDLIYQYSLSTPWDLTTASYTGVSFEVGGQDNVPFGLIFKPDGLGFFMSGSQTASIHQYTLSIPWDLSTASYDGLSFYVGSQERAPYGLFFRQDASGFYVTGVLSDKVHQYSLGV